MSGGTRFPRKFYPTGQDILSASRIICPGLGGKSVGPNFILALHSYKSSYEPTCQKQARGVTSIVHACSYVPSYYIMS